MDKQKIEEHDIVDVYFVGSQSMFGYEVLYTPQATGDSWHLQSLENKTIVYVQLFERMDLVQKPHNNRRKYV